MVSGALRYGQALTLLTGNVGLLPPDRLIDRFPRSQTAALLGQTMIDFDQKRGWVRFSFIGRDTFRNPAGNIQGGLLTAMLDDTMGPAAWLMTNGELYPTTIDVNVSFLVGAKPGLIYGEGRVVQLGKTIAFLEAHLPTSATSSWPDRHRRPAC